jgi:Entner-Doudoroff aldolase
VIDVAQVELAARLGAAFAVSPGLDAEIAEACATNGLPVMPGVATSSEIQAARRLGLVWLKAFPVAQLGSAWVRAQLAPFPEARFVATGGVDADNAREFLDAGARVAAIGSALADDNQLAKLATFAPPRAVS